VTFKFYIIFAVLEAACAVAIYRQLHGSNFMTFLTRHDRNSWRLDDNFTSEKRMLSVDERERERGERRRAQRGRGVAVEKKTSGERGKAGNGGAERERERDLARREKADTADVAGERNAAAAAAAGTSGRKLGGSGTRGNSVAGRGKGEGRTRGGRLCFRHLKPAVGARILFSLSS